MDTKICVVCNVEKCISDFPVHSIYNGKASIRSECKDCKSVSDSNWHRDDRLNNPETYILRAARGRARKKNILFDIDESDIIIPTHCPILGIELKMSVNSAEDNSPSLDRILPDKGYIKGNCAVISVKANRMKQDNSLETLEKIISYMKKHLNGDLK